MKRFTPLTFSNMTTRKLLLALFILCVIPACTMSPATHMYTLHGMAMQGATTAVQYPLPPTITYGVGPVFLPAELNQPGIVAHERGQQIDLAMYNIWAGNLKDAITRVVASNLSDLTGLEAIWPFPWDNRNRPGRQVRIVVEHLSGELTGPVLFKTKWAVTASNGEQVLLQKRSVITAPVREAGYPGYVSAINELMNKLSVEIASEISKLP